jgi:hypothetical protein
MFITVTPCSGINLRYLGKLAELAASWESTHPRDPRPAVLELLETEMVARVARRLLDDLLREPPALRAAPAVAVAHFLSALLARPTQAAADAAALWAAAAAADGADGSAEAANGGPGSGSSSRRRRRGVAKASDEGNSTPLSANGIASTGSGAVANGPGSSSNSNSNSANGGGSSGGGSSGHGQRSGGGAGGGGASYGAGVDVTLPDAEARHAIAELGWVAHHPLWRAVAAEVRRKFGWELRLWGPRQPVATTSGGGSAPTLSASSPSSPTAPARVDLARAPLVPLLRRLAQKCGLQLAARAYDFEIPGAAAAVTPDDLLGLVPVSNSSHVMLRSVIVI